jgi:hypothetical protein
MHMRAVWKVSSHFEYLENWSCGFDVTWQPVRGNLTVHPHSSCAGFFGKSSHHPRLSAPLQPRFGSLRLLDFPKAKTATEREVICECDGHTLHKLSQRCLTDDWLAPRESDCSRMCSNVSSDWLPGYINAMQTVLKIFKMGGYFPDSPCYTVHLLVSQAYSPYTVSPTQLSPCT